MNVSLNSITGSGGIDAPYDYVNTWLANPFILSIVILIIFGYYIFFASLGQSSTMDGTSIGSGNGGSYLFEILIWGVALALVVLNGLRYFYGSDITANISKLFSEKPELDITVTPPSSSEITQPTIPELQFEKQVFHIPGNNYTYEQGKAICTAYGGRLANYNEVDEAYKDGADWCSYGWSDNQMALFPTQEQKWQNLQKIKGHENDCGRPGINGGFIANPDARFGVNCYGYKPKITSRERKIMETTPEYPITKKDIDFQNMVEQWKQKIPDILIAPFNHDSWSSF